MSRTEAPVGPSPRSPSPLCPTRVMPEVVARAVADLPYWFVIGGQAMRCFCPYRPSVDVDFGVGEPRTLGELLAQLQRAGTVELIERGEHTVHLRFDGVRVSVFVLDRLVPHTEARRLTVTGLLATKLHAILDRGTRRDFFDLYVTLQQQRLGIIEALGAMRRVYGEGLDEGLLLRALTYFDDAEREAPLPGEGARDWETVKDFFVTRVGHLLVPPGPALEIQSRRVDVR